MKLRYRYFLYPDKKDKYIVLLDRLEGKILFKSWGFKAVYDYILYKKIHYNDIKLKDYTYLDLFNDFVDESSINPNIKRGGRI